MSILGNPKHEAFAQKYAKSGNATRAYIAAGYSGKAAEACASRLLTKAKVQTRVEELKRTFAEQTIKAEIRQRSARVQALQDRWDRLKACH